MVKALRAWPPANNVATSVSRRTMSVVGRRSEFLIQHLPRVGLVESPLPNGAALRLRSRGDDWVSNQVYWRGWRGYEPEVSGLFYAFARGAAVTLDIGAHVGFYSILAALTNPRGQVRAFEPMPRVYRRLIENVALNSGGNVQTYEVALGDVSGQLDLWCLPEGIPSSSGLSDEFYSQWEECLVRVPVTVRTADELLESELPIDLVKVDTETSEHEVIQGMSGLLQHRRPTIFCEILHGYGDPAAIEKVLGPLGYRYFLLTADGPVPRESIAADPTWSNHLFTCVTETAMRDVVAESRVLL